MYADNICPSYLNHEDKVKKTYVKSLFKLQEAIQFLLTFFDILFNPNIIILNSYESKIVLMHQR